jgi:hypothetical protein
MSFFWTLLVAMLLPSDGFLRNDRIAIESLITEVLLDISDYHIVVVNDLTNPDQQFVSQILNGRKLRSKAKDLLLVHNWRTQPISK